LDAEGVGDAPAGGVGLPVDAVRVDLEQDRMAATIAAASPRVKVRPLICS
jgi:hypothetical protein